MYSMIDKTYAQIQQTKYKLKNHYTGEMIYDIYINPDNQYGLELDDKAAKILCQDINEDFDAIYKLHQGKSLDTREVWFVTSEEEQGVIETYNNMKSTEYFDSKYKLVFTHEELNPQLNKKNIQNIQLKQVEAVQSEVIQSNNISLQDVKENQDNSKDASREKIKLSQCNKIEATQKFQKEFKKVVEKIPSIRQYCNEVYYTNERNNKSFTEEHYILTAKDEPRAKHKKNNSAIIESFNGDFYPNEELVNKERKTLFKGDSFIEFCDNGLRNSQESIQNSLDDIENGKAKKQLEDYAYAVYGDTFKNGLCLSQGIINAEFYIKTNDHEKKKVSMKEYRKFKGEKYVLAYQSFKDVYYYNIDQYLDKAKQSYERMQDGDIEGAFQICNIYTAQAVHDVHKNNTYKFYVNDTSAKLDLINHINTMTDDEKKKYFHQLRKKHKSEDFSKFILTDLKIYRDKNSMKFIRTLMFDIDLFENVEQKIHFSSKEKKDELKKQMNLEIEHAMMKYGLNLTAKIESCNGFQIVLSLDKTYYLNKADYEYHHNILKEDCGYLSYEHLEELFYFLGIALGYEIPIDMNATFTPVRIFRFPYSVHMKHDNKDFPVSVLRYIKDLKDPKNLVCLHSPEELIEKLQTILTEHRDMYSLKNSWCFYSDKPEDYQAFKSFRKEFHHHKNAPYVESQNKLCDYIVKNDYEGGKDYILKLFYAKNRKFSLKNSLNELAELSDYERHGDNPLKGKCINLAHFKGFIPFEKVNETEKKFPNGRHNFSSDPLRIKGENKTVGNVFETFNERGISESKCVAFFNKAFRNDKCDKIFYYGLRNKEIDNYILSLYKLVEKFEEKNRKNKNVFKYCAQAIRVLAITIFLNFHSNYQNIVRNGYFVINANLIDTVNEIIFGCQEKLGYQYMMIYQYLNLFNLYYIDSKEFGIPQMNYNKFVKGYTCINLKSTFNINEIMKKVENISKLCRYDYVENIFTTRYTDKQLKMFYKDIYNSHAIIKVTKIDGIVADKETLLACDISDYFTHQKMSNPKKAFMKMLSGVMVYIVDEELSNNIFNELRKTETGIEELRKKIVELSVKFDVIFNNIYSEFNRHMLDHYTSANGTFIKKKSYFSKTELKSYYEAIKFNLLETKMALLNKRFFNTRTDYCINDCGYRDFETYRLTYLYTPEARKLISKFISGFENDNVDVRLITKLYKTKSGLYDVCSKYYDANKFNVSFSQFLSYERAAAKGLITSELGKFKN